MFSKKMLVPFFALAIGATGAAMTSCSETHLYSEWEITKEPTCVEAGEKQRVCSICSGVEVEEIEATGHTYDTENVEVVEATCEEVGKKTYKCLHCESTVEEEISALGHNYVHYVVEKLTEVGIVNEEYDKCTVCGNVKDLVTDTVEHDFAVEVKEPTCKEFGYTTHTCKDCDFTYISDYTEKTDHKYSVESVEATCTEDGKNIYTCEYCGTSYEEIVSALGHDYIETVREATCVTDGYTIHVCSICNDTYVDNYIAASGHTYVENEDGKFICSICESIKPEDGINTEDNE